MDEQDGWISPREAERMVRLALPELSARQVLARWIERGKIELYALEGTQWIDEPGSIDPLALAEYRLQVAQKLQREIEYPYAARINRSPDPARPIPLLKRETLDPGRIPLESIRGANFACGELWDLAEIGLRITRQRNSEAKVVYSGVRLRMADVETALRQSGIEAIRVSPPVETATLRGCHDEAPNGEMGPKSPAVAAPLDGAWTNRIPEKRTMLVFKFFENAKLHLAGGSDPLSATALRDIYTNWLRNKHPGENPYSRSSFEQWLERFQHDWRIKENGRGFEHSPE